MSGLTTFTLNGITYIFDYNGIDDIQGTSGSDVIFAGDGDDIIDAGAGNDLILAGSGNDTVYGGAGDDIVLGGSGHDLLFGQKGDDVVSGGTGNDIVKGGSGADFLVGGHGNDKVIGGAGDDILFGGYGADILKGGSGNDHIYAGYDNDLAIYVVGNNTGDSDYYNGGDGIDKLRIKLTSTELNALIIPAEYSTAQEKIDYIEGLLQADGSADFNALGFDLVVEKFEIIDVQVQFLNDIEFVLSSNVETIKEGESVDYSVAFSGTLAAGTSASVDIALNDLTTSAADRSDIVTAINAAVAAASGVSFDGTTITFDAGGDTSLTFTLNALDDDAVEGDEDYAVQISNAATTGVGTATISVGNDVVGTTIIDTPPIFTNNNNNVNLDTLNPDDFNTALGVQNALNGNDDVWLPNAGASILSFGYDPLLPFEAGDGDDIIRPGDLDDIINGDIGSDEVNYAARAVAVNLSVDSLQSTATLGVEVDTLISIESFVLTSQDDEIDILAFQDGLSINAGDGNDTLDLLMAGTEITFTASTAELTDGIDSMTVENVETIFLTTDQTFVADAAGTYNVETRGNSATIRVLEGNEITINLNSLAAPGEAFGLKAIIMEFTNLPGDSNPDNIATLDFATGTYSFNATLVEYALLTALLNIIVSGAIILEGESVEANITSLADFAPPFGTDPNQPFAVFADDSAENTVSLDDKVNLSSLNVNNLFLSIVSSNAALLGDGQFSAAGDLIDGTQTKAPLFFSNFEEYEMTAGDDYVAVAGVFDGILVNMAGGVDTLDLRSLAPGVTYDSLTGILSDGVNSMTISNVENVIFPLQTVRVSENTTAPSFAPSISDDGNFVVYTSLDANLVPGDFNGTADIFLYDVNAATTSLVSVDSGGFQANGSSNQAAINADGSFVVFDSFATNLAPGDVNAAADIFVRDIGSGTTTLVSVDSFGDQGNSDSSAPDINADGSIVAFHSFATNLAPGDVNGFSDIFIHDLNSGTTTMVSVDSGGTQGNIHSFNPSINADGSSIAFESLATNLVAGDSNGFSDIFVHDTDTGMTERISVDDVGNEANDLSIDASISADGNLVAYTSFASNLVANDTNGFSDVFLYDRTTQTTTLISENISGSNSGNGNSFNAEISSDGAYVVFDSAADDLIAGDTNGLADIYLYEVATGDITRVSVADDGAEADGNSSTASIADDLSVVYRSDATNLISLDPDVNGVSDIYGLL